MAQDVGKCVKKQHRVVFFVKVVAFLSAGVVKYSPCNECE
jgi:hypothetical protein